MWLWTRSNVQTDVCHRQTAAPAGPGSDGPQGKWGTFRSLRVYRVLPCLFCFFSFQLKEIHSQKSKRWEKTLQAPSAIAEAYAFPFFLLSLPPSFPSFGFLLATIHGENIQTQKSWKTVIQAALLLPLEPVAENSFSWLLYLAWYSLRCNSHATKFTLWPFSGFWYICKAVRPPPSSNSRPFSPHQQESLCSPEVTRHPVLAPGIYSVSLMSLFRHFISMESHNTGPYTPGFFHFA